MPPVAARHVDQKKPLLYNALQNTIKSCYHILGGDTMAEDTKGITVRLDPDLWRRLRIYSIDTGESIQALSVRLLTDYLDKYDKKTAKKL